MAVDHSKIASGFRISTKINRFMNTLGSVSGVYELAGNPDLTCPKLMESDSMSSFTADDELKYGDTLRETLRSQLAYFTGNTDDTSLLDEFLSDVTYDEIDMSIAKSSSSILEQLGIQMGTDSKNVVKNTCTAPTLSAGGNNIGDGILYTYAYVKGWSDDHVASETLWDGQRVEVICTNDNRADNTSQNKGDVQFTAYLVEDETNGIPGGSTGLTVIIDNDGTSKITNKQFQLLTDNSFEGSLASGSGGWSYGTGFSLSSGASFNGDIAGIFASGASSTVYQTIGQNGADVAEAGETYICELRAQAKTANLTAGKLTVQMNGTGISAVSLFDVDAIATGSWTRKYAIARLPVEIPQDLAFQIIADGNLDQELYIDSVRLFKPTDIMTAINSKGLFLGITRGATDDFRASTPDLFGSGDCANDEGGKIQTFIAKRYGTQLPSGAAASADWSESDV